MPSYNLMFKLGNSALSNYKCVFSNRINNVLFNGQYCYYAKTAEQKLGIDKPKRPMTPFLKFLNQTRPALVAKNPNVEPKVILQLASKHWQQLDSEVKANMSKEYEKDIEDYRKIKEIYESSLTPAQKEEIEKVKAEILHAKEKRKVKAELKELGKPKKPKSSYMLYCDTERHTFKELGIKEFSKRMQSKWANLPASEKSIYEKKAKELMDKYKKDIQVWEEKMIATGHLEYVKVKKVPALDSATKTKAKKQQ